MLRFAISPTADMDINSLRIAIFNFILSKQKNEELLIRIDDTDKEKNIEGKYKEILEQLNLFSIEHSRVIAQSENIKYHIGMGMNLLLDKKAFNCFCSDEALEEDRKKAEDKGKVYSYSGFCENISDETKFHCNAPFVVRVKKPSENIKFNDILKGDLEYKPYEVDSVVILNRDKTPSANFASAVDDMLYDISLIVADEKSIANTPKQIHIRETLGYDKKIEYVHLENIENAPSVKSLIDGGFLPSAIANYLVLLDFDTPKEIFTLEEAIEWFDIAKLSNEPIKFDIEKLKTINKDHLKTIDDMRFSKLLGFADTDIGVLGKIYLEELSTIKDIKAKVDSIFGKKDSYDDLEKEYIELVEYIKALPYIDSFEEFKKQVKQKSELDDNEFDKLLRYALTGTTSGPDLVKIYPCIKNYLGEIV